MDTKESKTAQEEEQHMKEVRMPEDFEHPEPDEDQPEAKQPPQNLQWILLVAALIAGAILVFTLVWP